MKPQTKFVFTAVVFILCISLALPEFCRADDFKKHVLVINSYSKGYAWTDIEVKGIEDVLSLEKNLF
ncbi:MAG: hypothetical protein HUK40_14060 [Desulfobacter sp.]|nr:hypothetical protein [Desulfobacter sp.]